MCHIVMTLLKANYSCQMVSVVGINKNGLLPCLKLASC